MDAWVTTRARTKPSFGMQTIHGGANVTMLRMVAPISARMLSQDNVVITRQTSR